MANGVGDCDERDERQQSPAAVKLEPTRMVRTVKGNWKKSDEEEVDYEKRGLISVSFQTDSSYLGKLPGLVVHDNPDDFFFSLSSPYPIELSGKKVDRYRYSTITTSLQVFLTDCFTRPSIDPTGQLLS
ncbi:hypothetical protein K449DRAFT_440282 [Hypoxylon sp. EC38]|nr:hypothetical protein K449DRAFT_440282 [Hypoxylon sp. EC38]